MDRADLNGDASWSEYGDRYMLKLFRDYIFHQVTTNKNFLNSSQQITGLHNDDGSMIIP